MKTLFTILFFTLYFININTAAPHDEEFFKTVAPISKMVTTKGNTVDFVQDLKDGYLVIFDFYATWCGPCKADKPLLESMWKEFNKNGEVLKMYGIDCDGGTGWETLYPQIKDGKTIASSWGVRSMPTYYVMYHKKKVDSVYAVMHTGANSVTSEAGKSFLKDLICLNDNSTSIDNVKDNTGEQISVFVNNENGTVDFKWDEKSLSDIKIYNISGKLIRSFNGLSDNQLSFSYHSLAKGVYIVQLNTAGETISEKFIVR